MLIYRMEISESWTIIRSFLSMLLCCIVMGGLAGCSSSGDELEGDQITFPQTDIPSLVFSDKGGVEKVSLRPRQIGIFPYLLPAQELGTRFPQLPEKLVMQPLPSPHSQMTLTMTGRRPLCSFVEPKR